MHDERHKCSLTLLKRGDLRSVLQGFLKCQWTREEKTNAAANNVSVNAVVSRDAARFKNVDSEQPSWWEILPDVLKNSQAPVLVEGSSIQRRRVKVAKCRLQVCLRVVPLVRLTQIGLCGCFVGSSLGGKTDKVFREVRPSLDRKLLDLGSEPPATVYLFMIHPPLIVGLWWMSGRAIPPLLPVPVWSYYQNPPKATGWRDIPGLRRGSARPWLSQFQVEPLTCSLFGSWRGFRLLSIWQTERTPEAQAVSKSPFCA